MIYSRYKIGQKLRDIRIDNGLTIVELAERLGISVSHVNQIERGYRNMSLDLLMRYMDEFDVDANSILMCADKRTNSIDDKLSSMSQDNKRYFLGVFNYMIQTREGKVSV